MNNLKIGDKVRLKKLSEEKFYEIYIKKYNDFLGWNYNEYLDFYNRFSNKILEIMDIGNDGIDCKNCGYYFYKEELEKISYLKTKFKIVNKILNKKRINK